MDKKAKDRIEQLKDHPYWDQENENYLNVVRHVRQLLMTLRDFPVYPDWEDTHAAEHASGYLISLEKKCIRSIGDNLVKKVFEDYSEGRHPGQKARPAVRIEPILAKLGDGLKKVAQSIEQ